MTGARARAAILLLLLPAATPAGAGDVTSPGPDGVAVTIYRDRPMRTAQLAKLGDSDTHGLALVVEARVVDLPAGRSRLRFEGVTDGIMPQSASVEGLPAAIIERDFDYDLLTPATLVARSVGQTVQRVRTNPRTGRETRESAVIRSAPDGVVLEVGGHFEALKCGGDPERLVFDHAPAGLAARPTLSVAINMPAAGRYKVRLSYLTVRMDWSADYIARVAPDGRSLALTGWITLSNRTATDFAGAPTEVVAGHLARVPVDIPEPDTPPQEESCWPSGSTHAGWPPPPAQPRPPEVVSLNVPAPMMARSMVSVTARKRAIESQLGDYKLYTLPEPTTVAARQTKQVLFLDQPAVRFETVYAHTVVGSDGSPGDARTPAIVPTQVVLRFDNTAATGLGRALPEGAVQVRRSSGDGPELLVGEAALTRDAPVGAPFEITLGQASDVTVSGRVVSETRLAGGRIQRTFEIAAANAKAAPVTAEIRHDRSGETSFRVVAESVPHGLKAADPVWRLTLPAGSRQTLRYTVEYRRP